MSKTSLIKRQQAWLRAVSEKTGWSFTRIAQESGVAQSTTTRFVNSPSPTSALSTTTMDKIAHATGFPAFDTNAETVNYSGKRVPLLYRVGAGAMVYPYTDGEPTEYVDAPPEASSGMSAMLVEGDSMWPAYKDGDTVYIDAKVSSLAEAHRKECVVSLTDGRVVLKTLVLAANGSVTLTSHNAPPMDNVSVEWAAPVRWVSKAP